MPLCFAHPAIVLPISKIHKRWFSLTGLVMGSITPDFEYFARMRGISEFSHTWPGLFWLDLPLSLMLMVFWNDLIKNTLIDHLPPAVNKHLSPYKNAEWPYFKYNWTVIVPSVFIGAASHIFWDGFTHDNGFFVQHISFLSEQINIAGHSLYVYSLLQHLSTFLGLLFIVLVIGKLPKGEVTSGDNILLYWAMVAGVIVLTAAVRITFFIKFHNFNFGDLMVSCVSGFLLGLILTSSVLRPKQDLTGFA